VEAIARQLRGAGIGVSFFVDPDPEVVQASAALGRTTIELHTGDYCRRAAHAPRPQPAGAAGAGGAAVADAGCAWRPGTAWIRPTSGPVAALPNLEELNIGTA
jgi:pyridoxine 5-phosphate synthase